MSRSNFLRMDYTATGVIPINTILLETAAGASPYHTISFQVASIGATGVITPEVSNNGSTWVTATVFTPAGATATTVNAAGIWTLPVTAQFFRLRLSTATTSGTTTVALRLLDHVSAPWLASVPVTSVGTVAEDAATTAAPAIVGGVVRTARAPATLVAGDAARVTMTSEGSQTVHSGAPITSTDVASAARTTSGNSGWISTPVGGSTAFFINVTASGGTTPTLDLILEETYDNGVSSALAIYHVQRITGTGVVNVPPMLSGGHRRWSWVIGGGGGQTFTFSITSTSSMIAAPLVRQIYDRTANVLNGTLNTTTNSVNVAGCRSITGVIRASAASVYAQYQIQLSIDNSEFASVGTPVTATSAPVFIQVPAGMTANFARMIVSTGGTGQSAQYAAIIASG